MSQTILISKMLFTAFNAGAGAEPIAVVPAPSTPESLGLPSGTKLQINRTLKNPSIRIDIPSFPVVPYPESLSNQYNTSFEESIILRDNVWLSSARLDIEVVKASLDSNSFTKSSKISIVNRGIPYSPNITTAFTKDTEGILKLGNNGMVYLRILPVNAGGLKNNDSIVFEGDYEEIIAVADDQVVAPDTVATLKVQGISFFMSDTSQSPVFPLVPEGSNRCEVFLQNIGTASILLMFENPDAPGYLLSPGFKFKWNFSEKLNRLAVNSKYKFTGSILGKVNNITQNSGYVALVGHYSYLE